MKRPLIGIIGNILVEPDSDFVSARRIYVNEAYSNRITDAGGVPLLLPCAAPAVMSAALNVCDGLLLPGGWDIDPALYQEDPHPLLGALNPALDRQWLFAATWALEKHLPTLGICRGMQLLSVAAGGSLYQDLSLRKTACILHKQQGARNYAAHKITVSENSALLEALGTRELYVNTLHHQCVKDAGRGFIVTATASDGVPEAMESSDGLCLAVQWHPEELPESMSSLFEYFVAHAAESKRLS